MSIHGTWRRFKRKFSARRRRIVMEHKRQFWADMAEYYCDVYVDECNAGRGDSDFSIATKRKIARYSTKIRRTIRVLG